MHKCCEEACYLMLSLMPISYGIVYDFMHKVWYLLGVKREGDGDRVGARSLTWMRITVELLVRRLSTAHFSAFWPPFSLSIATATNPFTPSFFSEWCFGNHITLFAFLFQCNLMNKNQTKGTPKTKKSYLLFLWKKPSKVPFFFAFLCFPICCWLSGALKLLWWIKDLR